VAAFAAAARSAVVSRPSGSQNGRIRMPLSTAMLTVVVKDSTSTMGASCEGASVG
jgi:hypothetical protein